MTAKLYRSRTNCILGGVCGGLGQYLGIDPILVRLFFVLFTLAEGIGVPIYLALWLIVPPEGEPGGVAAETVRTGADEIARRAHVMAGELREGVHHPDPRAATYIGVALIGIGVIFLLRNLGWLHWFDVLRPTLLPALLIGTGVALLLARRR